MGGVRFELEVGMPYAVELRIMRAADGAVSDAYYQIGLREEGAGGDAELRAKIKARGEEIARVYGGRLLSKAETEAEALTRSHGGTEKSKNEGDLRKDVNELTNDEEGSLLWQLGCEWFPSWECRDSYKHKFEWGDAKEWIQ